MTSIFFSPKTKGKVAQINFWKSHEVWTKNIQPLKNGDNFYTLGGLTDPLLSIGRVKSHYFIYLFFYSVLKLVPGVPRPQHSMENPELAFQL